jgi:very-short-patch-repair endonuclease
MRQRRITSRARTLRREMTEPEVILWTRLRGRGGERPTFRRQHPFGALILDFYCPSLRLAIEVDGATHWDDAAKARDEARDRWLNAQGIEVMRIPASRIYRDLPGVMDRIMLRIEALSRQA